jgi:D-arabinitol dehydrogenase (NADP+)
LVEPLSCVLHAVEMLAPKMSDRALVMGAGPIGLMLGRVLKSRGIAQVDYLERLDERRNYAAKEGVGEVFASLGEVPEKHYECVLDATGVGMLVSEAANRFVRARGKVLIFGVPHLDSEIRLNHFRVMREEIQIISSFTSIKNTFQAIDLMRSGTVKMDGIISDRIPLSKAPEYVLRMKNGDGGIRKVTVTDFQA